MITPSSPLLYSLRRSSRAKNTRIIVTADKIEVVAPLKASERRIQAFVQSQRDWITAALKRVADKRQDAPRLAPSAYVDGVSIPYQGRHLPLRIESSRLKTLRVELRNDEIFWVKLPADLAVEQHSEKIRLALTTWMKNQARRQVQHWVDYHAPRFGLFPREVRIKTQKSRWGSCGIHDDIHINWLLIIAPPDVLEYVVVHELCHLHVRNHSAQFWALVAEHLPDCQQQRVWLKQQGGELMRYGMTMLA